MTPAEGSPLALDPDTMRRLGYRVVDLLVERVHAEPGPVVRRASPAELRSRLWSPPSDGPTSFDELLDTLERDVLPYVARLSHPGYLAFIPGEGTWPGALGDLIASTLNLDTCWWLGASGPSSLELLVVDWLRSWVGYPEGSAGILVSGGSAANLTALACARETRLGAMDGSAIVYFSDQSHSSLARAARALGFRHDQVRVIPSDDRARIRVDALRAAVGFDLGMGRRPLAVVANGGSTAVGAVDPLDELADLCAEHDLWLHVDGAYGAAAVLTERGRALFTGLERADSITVDPHKWLYQPVELQRGFEIAPDYLRDIAADDQEVNLSDRGLQLTRTCRALKLWLSVQYFGLDAFRRAIDTCLDLALHAEQAIVAADELELTSPASLGIVTFRRHPPGVDDETALERINASLAEQIEEQGDTFLSTCHVRGRLSLRLCILNHSTTRAEVDRALELAATLAVDASAARSALRESYPPLERGWLGQTRLDRDALRAFELFATLDDVLAERVLAESREHVAVAGEPVIEQWQTSRELYVLLGGAVEVTADGVTLSILGPGDFFGELAAIDWGAGFGRTRMATVTATAETRLLVLDRPLVDALQKGSPGFNDVVQRVIDTRAASL